MQAVVARVSESCHMCVYEKLPTQAVQHTTHEPPKVVGVSVAADILKRCEQNDCSSQHHKATTVGDALDRLSSELHSCRCQSEHGL